MADRQKFPSRISVIVNGGVVYSATVQPGESFSADSPRAVEAFGDHITSLSNAANDSILALREIDPGIAPISVVANWRELLNRHP